MSQFIVAFFIFWQFLPTVAVAGVLDLSRDRNKNGTEITTFVLAVEPIKKVSAIFIADNSGYGEIVAGTSLTTGNLTVTPHVGVEWVHGGESKGRGFVLTSFFLGKFTVNNVNEFAGVTGNFYKTTFGYQMSDMWKASLVHHSVAGSGVRLDFMSKKGVVLYLQGLERRMTIGVNLKF